MEIYKDIETGKIVFDAKGSHYDMYLKYALSISSTNNKLKCDSVNGWFINYLGKDRIIRNFSISAKDSFYYKLRTHFIFLYWAIRLIIFKITSK